MFHRVKTTEPAPQVAAPAKQATPQQANAPANPASVQQVSSKEEIRINENKAPAQNAKPEQNNAQPSSALIQNSNVQPSNSTPTRNPENAKKEDAKTMTEATKPNAPQDNAPRALEIPGSGAYQRPGQPPLRTAGTFPGAYPGYNPAAPGAAISSDRRLIIGRGITMSGEIESCDHLIVEGTVEASLKGASVLDIAESGVFYGTVEIDEATVAGRFEGDLQVNGRLTIRTGGAIKGSITYKELEVEAGATIDGRLSPVGAEHEAKKGNSKNRDAAKSKKDDAANSDDGLFSKQAAAE